MTMSLSRATDHTFHRLHRYIINGLTVASLMLAALGIVAFKVHGLVSLIRWVWGR